MKVKEFIKDEKLNTSNNLIKKPIQKKKTPKSDNKKTSS